MRIFRAGIVAAIMLGIVAGATPRDDGPSTGEAKVGGAAPNIVAMNPDGNSVLPDHIKGKVVLLAFWTFDPKSKSGMPLDLLRSLRRKFVDDKRFLILTVCVNDSDDREAWGDFLVGQGRMEYEGYQGLFINDPKWWNTVQADVEEPTTARRFGASDTPTYFLIDGDGRLAALRIPPDELQETIGRLLKPKP